MTDFAQYKELLMSDRETNKQEHNELFEKMNKTIFNLESVKSDLNNLGENFRELKDVVKQLVAKIDKVDICNKEQDVKIKIWTWVFRGLTSSLLIERIITYFKGGH